MYLADRQARFESRNDVFWNFTYFKRQIGSSNRNFLLYVEPLIGVTCTRNIEMIYNGTMVRINRDDDFANLSLPNECLSWEVGVFRSDLKVKRLIFQHTEFISLFPNRN